MSGRRGVFTAVGVAMTVLAVGLGAAWHGAGAAAKRVRLGFSASGLHHSAYVIVAKGMQEEAKRQDVELIVTDSKDQLAKQISDIEDLITKGVDALMVNAVAKGTEPVVEKAYDKGIKVLAIQRTVATPKIHQFIGSENVEVGRFGAEWVVKKLNGKGNVVVMQGIPGAASSDDRLKGSNEVWPKHPGIKIVTNQPGMYNRAKAIGVMENILQAHKEIDLIYCFNDDMAIGVVGALKAANRKAMVVGMDAIPDAVKAVERGEMTATIEIDFHQEGVVAVQNALKLIKGDKLPAQHVIGQRMLEKKS
jgi:ribose transport system substrate-binding protein